MRTKKTILNLITSLTSQFILIILGFVSRRVLIYNVGVEYLGINGLMSNILLLFSLAESGIGIAIGYNLYKPLAENDKETIKSLMKFYKKTYEFLSLFTLFIGLCFFPFLKLFLKENTVDNTNIIYLLFLFSSVSSYLFSYKVSLNNCDQNKYIFTLANTITQIFILVTKIIILNKTRNYILFLLVDIVSTLLKNIIFSLIVDRKYPYIKEKNIKELNPQLKKDLFKHIKALFIGKIGYIMSQSADNLVISSMISIKAIGLYSNYNTLITSVSGFVSMFISSITASMGNLIASESIDKQYDIYKKIELINDWLYICSSTCLFFLIEPFIILWLGKEFIISKHVLIIAVLLYFFKGINATVDMVKTTSGLFHQDRYIMIVEALINLAISLILVRYLDITGVLLGTLLSYLTLSFWIKPYIVFKNVFQKSFCLYIKKILYKCFVTTIIILSIYFLLKYIPYDESILNFISRSIVIVVVSNLILIILFKNEFLNIIKIFVRRI